MAAVKSTKLEELETALAGCTPDQQRILRPIIQSPGLLERLHDCLLRSDHNPSIFSKRIETDQSLAALILEKAEEYERHPEACTFSRYSSKLPWITTSFSLLQRNKCTGKKGMTFKHSACFAL